MSTPTRSRRTTAPKGPDLSDISVVAESSVITHSADVTESSSVAESAKEELDALRAALDQRLAASQHLAACSPRTALAQGLASLDAARVVDDELRNELEIVRLQIEAAHIAATAHANVVKEAREALHAERLAGATLHRLIADAEQRIAAIEQRVAKTQHDCGTRAGARERERNEIERAWSEAEARLERTNRDWSLEIERIRQSAGAAQAQTLSRCAQVLESQIDENEPMIPSSASALPVSPASPLDDENSQLPEPLPPAAPRVMFQPMRGANRQPFHEKVEVQVDGEAALLVDLSIRGAQVVSKKALKPNHAVRMLLPVAEKAISCKGQVVWARLEPTAAPGSLLYRAGMLFTSADETALAGFMTQYSSSSVPSTEARS